MKTTIRYNQPTRAERREAAVTDAMEYLQPAQWRVLKNYASHIQWSRLNLTERKNCFGFLTQCIHMTGIKGFPAYALTRNLITTYSK